MISPSPRGKKGLLEDGRRTSLDRLRPEGWRDSYADVLPRRFTHAQTHSHSRCTGVRNNAHGDIAGVAFGHPEEEPPGAV